MNRELQKELNGLKQDLKDNQRQNQRMVNRMSFLLKGEMGKDIHNVLEGRVKVKLTRKEKWNYKIKNFFNKLFSIF